MTIADAMNAAIQHEQAGRLAEAENIAKAIVAQQPETVAAWNLLAMIAFRQKKDEAAAQFIERALAIEPANAALHANLGELNKKMGRLQEATESFRKAVELEPQSSILRNKLGIALRMTGHLTEAANELERAIEIDPKYADPHNNRGNVLRDLGRSDEAMAEYRAAIALRPELAEAHANLGNVLGDRGQFFEAINEYDAALKLQPRYAQALVGRASSLRHLKRFDEALVDCQKAIEMGAPLGEAENVLGSVLYDQQRFELAVTAFRRAIELDPPSVVKRNNLAMALQSAGDLEEALATAKAAVELKNDYFEGFNTLGILLTDEGKYELAEAAFLRAIAQYPDYALAHWNLSLLLLLRGDYANGWMEHEWRSRTSVESKPLDFTQPKWDGGELNGKTILLHQEQGFGDMLQFIRYVPMVAQRGGKVVVKTPPELSRLLSAIPGISRVIDDDRLPDFDVHCPMLSLPAVFRTDIKNIPAEVPYLKAPADAAARWHEKIPAADGKFKIGIAWAGNPKRKLDQRRSLKLAQLDPILKMHDIEFYSLQKGSSSADAKEFPPLIDLSGELTDFAETAAAIEQLDLIITVDTAIAHLAGALGKPVWVMLGFVPAWRWMLNRSDSPWYPTMRLFRQPKMGDWPSVIGDVAAALREKLAGNRP